jgi:hypothetical protein
VGHQPLVTAKVTEFDEPFEFVTETAYVPGEIVTCAKGQGGLEYAQAGTRVVGTAKMRLLPFEERFGTTPVPKLTVFPVELKPEPLIVTLVPGRPDVGERDPMASGDGAVEPWLQAMMKGASSERMKQRFSESQ